jgi:hypothetical protein
MIPWCFIQSITTVLFVVMPSAWGQPGLTDNPHASAINGAVRASFTGFITSTLRVERGGR